MQLTWNCQHKEMETKFIAVRSISNSLLGKKKVGGVSLQINRSLESVWMVLSDQQVTTQTALPIRSYNNKKININ